MPLVVGVVAVAVAGGVGVVDVVVVVVVGAAPAAAGVVAVVGAVPLMLRPMLLLAWLARPRALRFLWVEVIRKLSTICSDD